ncbi:MAG: CBS domain-containing protein [Thermoanaerobaculales bacterium]|jgi:CBS domain-containing protein|nr:CBS domain-containing protein [Thermoanaerobaculales bacterium]
MKTVRQILEEKGTEVFDIAPDARVYDALAEMARRNVGALLVRDGEKLVGLISERDYARKVILKDKASKQIPVSEIMTTRVVCVSPEQRADGCMALMTDKHIRHLAVVADDRVVGVISIGDVVKAIIDQQRFAIEQLEHYITGGR